MEDQDFYARLGVPRDASAEDIKRAFRKLAHQHHPDKHKGDKDVEEKFKAINEAYETLKDPQKRAAYDRFGKVGGMGGPGFRDSGFEDFGFGDFGDIFSDVFTDFFGGPRRGSSAQRGADLQYNVEIDFEEAAFGTEKTVNVQKAASCSGCGGTGAKKGTSPTRCTECGGVGQQRMQQGFFTVQRTCPACNGAGTTITDPCLSCGGAGREMKTKDVTVKIPPGIDTGARLRLSGQGNEGVKGGPRGDLYIALVVRPHPVFERRGVDIICEVPIAFTQAALGAEIEVPTLEGPTKLKVPKGTQSGRVFRLSGKGIASVQSGRRGDEHVIVKIETPTKLNKRQQELLKEFASISGDDTMPLKSGFFDKVKDIFE